MKLKTTTFAILCIIISQNLSGQNLVSIHEIENLTQLNTLSPEIGSIIYVENESLNYQYDGNSWNPIQGDNINLDDIVNTITEYQEILDDCECRPFFEVGDTLQCGVVIYVEPDGRSGIICALEDLPDMSFGCPTNTAVAVTGTSLHDGLNNSMLINATCPTSAASACLNYNPCGNNDWYLPARNELGFMLNNLATINYVLIEIGENPIQADVYWSSSEVSNNNSVARGVLMGDLLSTNTSNTWIINFLDRPKTNIEKIRPIKRFYL